MNKPVLAKLSMGVRSLLIATTMLAVGSPLAAGSDATEMRRYRNDQFKFELDIPSQWAVTSPDLTNSPAEVIRIGSHEKGNHNLIVFRQSVGAGKNAKRLTDESERFLARQGFSNFVTGESVIGSHKAMTLDFERTTQEGGTWYCRHYIIVNESKAYVLGFGTTDREAMSELYDRMAKSFVFQNS